MDRTRQLAQNVVKPRVYMGCTIDPKNREGYYYALTSQGRVMADTIAGIKRLIRERERPTPSTQDIAERAERSLKAGHRIFTK